MGNYSDPSQRLPVEGSVGHESLELLRVLLKSNPHLETRVQRFETDGPDVTVLGLAVSLGQLQAAKLLIDHSANLYAVQRTYLDSCSPDFETDMLGLASKRGDLEMMRMLLDASMSTRGQSTLSYNLIKSLILAVTFSHEEATKLLFTHNVAVRAADSFLMASDPGQRLLAERALAKKNLGLHLILVSAGAMVDWPAVRDCYSFKLFHSIKQNDLQAAIELLSLEAPQMMCTMISQTMPLA
jgi:ankyrin repeat protein